MTFPNWGEGGSPTWEKFPHFPIFLGGSVPNGQTDLLTGVDDRDANTILGHLFDSVFLPLS